MEPVERVLRDIGDPDLVDTLAGLPGADLTTLLLHVMRRRADRASPADVMRQRAQDRFVLPSPIPLSDLHSTEQALLTALPDDFDTVTLAPVAPLGLHSAVARVDQHRVVSTIRRSEVAADPTAGLAVEAAIRRRERHGGDSAMTGRVHLASIQRVVRAQTFEGPLSFAHFGVLGLVSAGRDQGSNLFEIECLADHAAILSGCLLATGADHVTVTLTDWTGGEMAAVSAVLADEVEGLPVAILQDPERTRAREYYLQGAFQIDARFGGTTVDVGDGGLVDWTQHLLGSRKERLMISGLGIDRIAVARTPGSQPAARSLEDE